MPIIDKEVTNFQTDNHCTSSVGDEENYACIIEGVEMLISINMRDRAEVMSIKTLGIRGWGGCQRWI